MIRFVDLGRQLWLDEEDLDNPRQFCFFDTVTDMFISFDGEQVFDKWGEVEQTGVLSGLLQRCKALCPPWAVTGDPPG